MCGSLCVWYFQPGGSNLGKLFTLIDILLHSFWALNHDVNFINMLQKSNLVKDPYNQSKPATSGNLLQQELLVIFSVLVSYCTTSQRGRAELARMSRPASSTREVTSSPHCRSEEFQNQRALAPIQQYDTWWTTLFKCCYMNLALNCIKNLK